jgi:hypothetical protein
MKKLTLTLKTNGHRRSMLLPSGESIGSLCWSSTRSLLNLIDGFDYKMRIRQTKTQFKTTTFRLEHRRAGAWFWFNLKGHTPYSNVFLDDDTDKFLTKTFGDEGTVIYLRIRIEKI